MFASGQKSTPCLFSLLCRRYWVGDKESRHFDKAFIRRFVLDIRKLHNFQELSELSNDECPRDVFIRTPLGVICKPYIILHILIGKLYSYRRGLRVASFNNSGQCEGLLKGNGQRRIVPRFFNLPLSIKFTSKCRIRDYRQT